MGVTSLLQETWYRATGRREIAEALHAERQMVSHLQESIADLENRMREPGWQQMAARSQQEFSRQGLIDIAVACRLMSIKNPLIKRGLSLRQGYVHGQGVEIGVKTSRSDRRRAARSGQDVNAVVQACIDDPGNQDVLFGQTARDRNEASLGTDGNVFFACFTNPRTGAVQIRTIPFDEVAEIITDPDDAAKRQFYLRRWTERRFDLASGTLTQTQREAYYPAMGYRPVTRPRQIGSREVRWDAPVVHVKVNSPEGWQWGIPDAYAAIDWANAYREFLTDWATLVRALSRFAWRLTSKGSRQAQARRALSAAPSADPVTGERRHAGATASLPADMALEAIPKTGATIDSESGRPLATMVAAALDLPITMLLGDPGVTGARATAETLDEPTKLAMQGRRGLWTEVLRTILGYVIDQAAKAPDGLLKGTVRRDGDREWVELAGDASRTVTVDWPKLEDTDPAMLVDAIVKADSLGYIPPLEVLRLLLVALHVDDVDEILDMVTDDDGQFLPPNATAAQAAVDAFRRGEDPAAVVGDAGATGIEQQPPEAAA
ncbi:hypothetical protein [Actinoallomurus sp. CA-142502]|uniref:hypothetical protein n=2 Tax=Actinoallomurus sp. CA-142502 TaxID=3239885 RepID=UPI003D92CD30